MGRPSRVALTLLIVVSTGCGPAVPEPGTDAYLEATSAFYSGTAAMQVGDDLRARARLQLVTELVPEERAAWTNLAILALRRGEIDQGVEASTRALGAPPHHPAVARVAAHALVASGDSSAAIALLDPMDDLRSLVFRAELLGGDAAVAPLQQAAALAPENMAIAYRLALARGDDAAREWAAALLESPPPHPEPDVLETALRAVRDVSSVRRVGNVLMRARAYRDDLDAVASPPELVEEPIQRPLALEAAPSRVAPADLEVVFEPAPIPGETGRWAWAKTIHLQDEVLPSVVLSDGHTLHFKGDVTAQLPGTVSSTAWVDLQDLDQDFLVDVVVAGSFGVEVLFQAADGSFSPRPAALPSVPSATLVRAIDFDMEGDLDLIVGLESGSAVVLVNRGDGSFETSDVLLDANVRDFLWADLDADGDPDATVLTDAGDLLVLRNHRNARWAAPQTAARGVVATDVGDLNQDGVLDLAVLGADGAPAIVSWGSDGGFSRTELPVSGSAVWEPPVSLFISEIDNNGAFDWVVVSNSGTQVLLTEADGSLLGLPTIMDFQANAVAPLSETGSVDLVGITASGDAALYFAQGARDYQWKRIRPQAVAARGDRRINTFAVGGEVELRSGLLYQKQRVTGELLHFGLGDNQLTDVARITWPNGDVQVEFDLLSDDAVLAQQRLKGSCPWLFTFDGQEMRFVTDFLWRSPLGLRINAQETAGVATTSDWVRIPGEALQPVDGRYEIRITAELWESHFFDEVSLVVVDHPAGSEVFVDERFAFPPPADAPRLLTPPRPFASVLDAKGLPVLSEAAAIDGRYVAGFGRGDYQGIAEEHAVQMTLPPEAGTDPVLVAYGWVRPTDSSINVAIGQGTTDRPTSLQLEVPAPNGSWELKQSDLGFPSGKNKTVLIDLAGLWEPGQERRFRLRTNLEVYWDRLGWAERAPGDLRQRHIAPSQALLRYRGFSAVTAADSLSPEIPDYATLTASHPVWHDLVGYHTRYGDVRELIASVDDRYVIMNAGDEMIVRFDAPPVPPPGWERDFVLLGDGWVKDGDLNTTFSASVLPLPTHETVNYDVPPSSLENDPVYQAHPRDWERFHTRYVAPDRFRRALSGSR